LANNKTLISEYEKNIRKQNNEEDCKTADS
jgi:hypothetical protein